MNRAGGHQGGGGPPPLTALLLVTRDWQKIPISREIKRFAMRDSDRRARLDERKPKTMFLHRSKVTEEVVKSASQLLTWLTDPASSPSKTKYGRAADNAKDDSHHNIDGPRVLLFIVFCRFGTVMQ